MLEKKNTKTITFLFVLILPFFGKAQENGNNFRDIEPPPAPIDQYLIHFTFVSILIAAFFFYKKNLKSHTK